MEILGFIGYCLVLVLCVILFVKTYKKELQKEKAREKFINSLESRLACVEQRLWEIENNFDSHLKGE